MDFALSEEQRLLVETARRFVRTELMPLEREVEQTRQLDPAKARDIFEKSKALGLYAVNIPAEYGGGGLSAVDTCLAEEQFGHTTDILIRRAFGNVYEVLLLANELQRERWLEPAVRGERVFSRVLHRAGGRLRRRRHQEPRGARRRWLAARAGRRSSSATGRSRISSSSPPSPIPAAGAKGISLFIVDKGMPGFTVGRDQPMMGLAGTSHVELFFDNVRLGPEHLLGQEGRGLNHAFETLGRIRLAQIGARAVGKATRILDMMTDYARERRQFGKPIGEQQLIQQLLADSAIEINAARLLLLQAAAEIDQGRDARERISMVKVYAAEMLGRVADRAVQVFGGMGYCKDLPIEKFYRDARIFRIFDGTSEIHRTVIARSMLKHGAARFADVI